MVEYSKYIFTHRSDTSLMPYYPIPQEKKYKYLYVEFSAKINIADTIPDNYPTLRFAMIDTKGRRMYLYYSKRDLATLSKTTFIPKQWNDISATDMFTMSDYKGIKALNFELAVWNSPYPNDFKLRDLRVRIYGIK